MGRVRLSWVTDGGTRARGGGTRARKVALATWRVRLVSAAGLGVGRVSWSFGCAWALSVLLCVGGSVGFTCGSRGRRARSLRFALMNRDDTYEVHTRCGAASGSCYVRDRSRLVARTEAAGGGSAGLQVSC